MTLNAPGPAGVLLPALVVLWMARLILVKALGLKQLGAVGLFSVSLLCLCSLLHANTVGVLVVCIAILIWLSFVTFGGKAKLGDG
jgi:hypothetical protein